MTDQSGGGAWFAPRTYGYGSGLPIAWQGWVMIVVHLAVILAGLPLAGESPVIYATYTVIMALIPLPLYAAKTRGAWKWRWGRD